MAPLGERTVHFAVAGDVHGAWAEFARDLASASAALPEGASLAAVFQLGDAEATANTLQLDEVHIQPERRALSDFAAVISGDIRFIAPVYFIGGNHEPWPTLDRNGGVVLGGGALAPGVHYLGRSGCVEITGLRVAFLSGIRHPSAVSYRSADRDRDGSIQALNHYVDEEFDHVAQLGPADLLLTHDWPSGTGLVHKDRQVGDPRVRELLGRLRPVASFHGHHHRAEEAEVDGVPVFAMGRTGQGVPDAVSVFEWNPTARSVTRLRPASSASTPARSRSM